MIETAIDELQQRIAIDPGARGIGPLIMPGHLPAAARSLLKAKSVAIATGFYIAGADAFETDGPTGAWALAEALSILGIDVRFVVAENCVPLMNVVDGIEAIAFPSNTADALDVSHLVSIECVGRAADGRYYNLRGVDITAQTAAIDTIFLQADKSVTTIGIGDGGNEIGMGRVRDRVADSVPSGETIGSVVACDWLVVAGVSNWGAIALTAALSLLTSRRLTPDRHKETERLRRLVEAGAVDGRTSKREPTVDGLASEDYLEVIDRINDIVDQNLPSAN